MDLFKEFNITQNELAKEIGVDQAALSRQLTGKGESKNIKAFCYYFFTDDNNRKYDKEKKKKHKAVEKVKLPVNQTGEEITQNEPNEQVETAKANKEQIKKEEVWYKEYQKMSNLYFNTKEELDRYKFLIDELRVKRNAIVELVQFNADKEKENE